MTLSSRLAVSCTLTAMAAGAAQPAQAPTNPPICRARRDLVAPCFTVHGALRYYNGAPGVRIWRIGTARLLGVHGLNESGLPESPSVCPLPDGLRDTLEAGKEVIADFVVCPLTRDQDGTMQLVCVESVSHIRAKLYRF
jgi:hypothetical protein